MHQEAYSLWDEQRITVSLCVENIYKLWWRRFPRGFTYESRNIFPAQTTQRNAPKPSYNVKPEDLQAVWDRLRRKLSSIDGLPDNVNPQLKDEGIGEVFGIALGLTSDGFTYQELKSYADRIRDEIIRIPEAAKVENEWGSSGASIHQF